MDIFVPTAERGERDLELGELLQRARALLGTRASTYKRNALKVPPGEVCVVAAFTDDDADAPSVERAEIVLGEGASFSEALARARDAVMRGFVKVRRADGSSRVVNLTELGIRPVIA